MGLGTRHGRGGARHHRRAQRPHHHARTNHRNHRRARVVHHNNTHSHTSQHGQWLWSTAARRWAHERTTSTSATNASSTNGPSETYISFYAQTNEQSASSKAQCFSMCRVLSIFLWFAGIMLMSLGGFQTPAGFIGIGCLVCGIGFLVLTSMLSSGACSNLFVVRRSGEQQRRSYPRTRNRNGEVITREPAGYIATADPSPAYSSTDLSDEDKPPSYEEVTRGLYPPTISATILPTVPEDSLPNDGVNEMSELPYPVRSADDRYVPPSQGLNSNDQLGLPNLTHPTDGHTMPPPYYTSELENNQRANVPYTVSMVSPPVQVAATYTTPPPHQGSSSFAGVGSSGLYPPTQGSMRSTRESVSTIDGDSEYYYDDNSSVDSMNIGGSNSANDGGLHNPTTRTDCSLNGNDTNETDRDSINRSRSNSDHVTIETEQQNDENTTNNNISRLSATTYPRSPSMEVIYQSEC